MLVELQRNRNAVNRMVRNSYCRVQKRLLDLVDVTEHAAGNTDGQHRQLPNRLVLHAAWNVNDDALVDFDFLVVEHELTFPVDDVVNLVGLLVVVEFRILDLDAMDLRRRAVVLRDQAAYVTAGLLPRRDV